MRDDILVSASRGLTDDEAGHLSPSYDLATGRPGEPAPASGDGPLQGLVIERFDLQRSQARRRVVEAIDARTVAGTSRLAINGCAQ